MFQSAVRHATQRVVRDVSRYLTGHRLLTSAARGACLVGLVFGATLPDTMLSGGFSAGTAASRVSPGQQTDLTKLRHRADAARRELRQGTRKWEAGRVELDRAQRKLLRTEKRLYEAERQLSRIRGPVAEIANATYQGSTAQSAAALLASAKPQAALRTAADVEKLSASRVALIDEAAQTHARRTRLAREANNLRKSTTAKADRLARLMHELQAKAASAVAELTEVSQELGVRVSREARTPVGCDPAEARRATQYPNGLVPRWTMCELSQSGELLRADAAVGFYQLDAAYRARFGSRLCVTDSYRPLAEQQRIYAERPSMAAVPGSSLHGLGLAVDLCGGVEQYGSVQYNWMVANAERFGWYHPSWARGSQFEPWHWEFDADSR